jgi:GntR family transcriptional regulator, rspAB operon transcriptional repressor
MKTTTTRGRKKTNGQEARVKAYEGIKQRILSMELKPGEVISENKLSQQLQISRTPIREALKQLEQDGLIVSSNRRKRVFMLTIHEVEEIFDLKIAVESHIARWAAERGDAAAQTSLQHVVQQMRQFAEVPPDENTEVHAWTAEWLEVDEQFHALLYQMAGNKRAEQIIRNLNYQWHRLRVGLLAMEGRIEKSVAEHQAIAQAVIAGDGPGAEAAMQEHLSNLKRMIVTIMSAFHFPT